MRQYQGLPASAGIIIGPAQVYQPTRSTVSIKYVHNPEKEWLRLQAAVTLTLNELRAIEKRARVNIGEQEAAIFQAHQKFLEDAKLMDEIRHAILQQGLNAELAVKISFDKSFKALSEVENSHFKSRAQDLKDVANRLQRCLQDGISGVDSTPLTHPAIIVAENLTPSDTIQFDKDKVLGLCTAKGGPTSHTAILARSLGIPAVVSASFNISDIKNGVLTVLDGNEGYVNFGPTSRELNLARERQTAWEEEHARQMETRHQSATTRDGHTLEVMANIGGVDEVKKALDMGAEGVGLLRTEFLYLGRKGLLDLNRQIAVYHRLIDAVGGRPFVVRTLDIGGDKSVPYLDAGPEPTPFLGWRSIRLVRERPDIFANQLEALLLAGVNADLRIMLPMVSGIGEVQRAREILDEVCGSLRAKGMQIAERFQFGAMIEVPAAALLAEHLAPHVDFFSIGTNDLTQYTIAVDRTSERDAALGSPYNPAVLKLIAITIEAAHKYGKWVGLCGELAGDTMAVPLLLGLGLDEFSMAPANIPSIKQSIRQWSIKRCQDVAKRALAMPRSTDVIQFLRKLRPS